MSAVANVCFCGTQSGYPHAEDCPYPKFAGGEEQERLWMEARDSKRALAASVTQLDSDVEGYMDQVKTECEHLRKRARQFLNGEIDAHHLANSVILHTNKIARED